MPDEVDRYEDSPIAWFAELILAQHRGDFRRAAESKEELERLGWTVKYLRPLLDRKAGGR